MFIYYIFGKISGNNTDLKKYPEKSLFWGLAPLPAYSGKKGLVIRSPHTSNKYPIYPSGPAVAPVQQPDSYYPATSYA
jgi:hypothetical protein